MNCHTLVALVVLSEDVVTRRTGAIVENCRRPPAFAMASKWESIKAAARAAAAAAAARYSPVCQVWQDCQDCARPCTAFPPAQRWGVKSSGLRANTPPVLLFTKAAFTRRFRAHQTLVDDVFPHLMIGGFVQLGGKQKQFAHWWTLMMMMMMFKPTHTEHVYRVFPCPLDEPVDLLRCTAFSFTAGQKFCLDD